MEVSTPAGRWQHQQVAVFAKRQHAQTQGTRGTLTPASILPLPDNFTCQGQIEGFTLLKPKGIYGLRQSTALVWERFCALQMQGSSNGGNWSYCSCFPQSWHQVGMFLSTPHCEVQEKSNPTTLISLCGQIVFKEHERSKAPLGSLSLFPVKAAAAALTLGAAQLRFLTPCQ